MSVAVVGVGAMGARIAERLLETGDEVFVWNRSPGRSAAMCARGAIAVATPREAARRATVVITMVSDPGALRDVSEGKDGIASGTTRSSIIIEMSTVGPSPVARLASMLPADTQILDAPVLGSVGEAARGELTIFVGGDSHVVERAQPLLTRLGLVKHVGPLGSGAKAKLVGNATLFGSVALLGEAISLARALGLEDDVIYDVLAATPIAAQAARRRDLIEVGEYPARFSLALARKDADVIHRYASSRLRVIGAARDWLVEAEEAGRGNLDYTALLAQILTERPRRAAATRSETLAGIDGLIVDLDGVVWVGAKPIPGVPEAITAIRESRTRVLFLTNDPSLSRAEQADRLSAAGIPVTENDVLTSSAATAQYLAARDDLRDKSPFVIGSPSFHQELAQHGFDEVPARDAARAQLVVIGGHDHFDFAQLRAATRAACNGAKVFAAGRDSLVPTPDGPEPGTGAILAAVETAAGVTGTVIGKPEPLIFGIALRLLSGCNRIAVVGDNLSSDIAGAKRSGIPAVLVLTGSSSRADISGAAYEPDLVVDSLADLPGILGCSARKTEHIEESSLGGGHA